MRHNSECLVVLGFTISLFCCRRGVSVSSTSCVAFIKKQILDYKLSSFFRLLVVHLFFFQTSQTSCATMIRSASRGARAISEHLGRQQVTTLRCSRVNNSVIGSRSSFSTQKKDDAYILLSNNASYHEQPQPLAAVAYAWEFDHEDEMDETCSDKISSIPVAFSAHSEAAVEHDVTGSVIGRPVALAGGGSPGRGPSSSTPYPPPSSMVSSKSKPSRKVGGGGGGSGRHRCPKCGTTVTFRCDFEENTFYCASCSGWFVVNPNTIMANEDAKPDGSPYEEFMAKNLPRRTDPEILMRHVR